MFEVTDADGSLSYDNMQISIVPRAGAAEDTIFDIDKQQESDGHITVRLTALVELDYDFVRLFIFTIAAHVSECVIFCKYLLSFTKVYHRALHDFPTQNELQ